jgi:hypothetical protein
VVVQDEASLRAALLLAFVVALMAGRDKDRRAGRHGGNAQPTDVF